LPPMSGADDWGTPPHSEEEPELSRPELPNVGEKVWIWYSLWDYKAWRKQFVWPVAGTSVIAGITEGWIPATVVSVEMGIAVRVDGVLDLWGARRSAELVVPPEDCVRERPDIDLSLLVVRWNLTSEDWRRSDYDNRSQYVGYDIIRLQGGVEETVGRGRYEVVTVLLREGSEADHIPSMREELRAPAKAAFYFVWPSRAGPGPAYVPEHSLYSLMTRMEANAVPTRWPNLICLYKTIVGKLYVTAGAAVPDLRVPMTIRVPTAWIAADPRRAADKALALWRARGQNSTCGVAKIGCSWQGVGVRSFDSPSALADRLTELISEPGSRQTDVMVQEFIPGVVCELRIFTFRDFTEDDAQFPSTHREVTYMKLKPEKRQTTGGVANFGLADCVSMTDAEVMTELSCDAAAVEGLKADGHLLVDNWLRWLECETMEIPPVIRFDFLVSQTEDGFKVYTGEVTEVGGSMSTIASNFRSRAVVNSCFALAPTRPAWWPAPAVP